MMLKVEEAIKPYLCSTCEETEAQYVFHDVENNENIAGVCQYCLDDAKKPGKFDGSGDIAAAVMLQVLSMIQYYDDSMFNEGWGFLSILDNWIFIEDTQGFINVVEFKSEEAALKEFDRYYAMGWGAQEDDIYVHHEAWRETEIYCENKKIPLWPNKKGEITDRRIDAAINLYMYKSGFYPSVWNVGERGDISLRKIRVVNLGE